MSIIIVHYVIFIILSIYCNSVKGSILWSEEFDGPKNTPPSEDKWTYVIGGQMDIAQLNNNDLQTYTNNISNAYLDGNGHLVITARLQEGISDIGNCYSSSAQFTCNLAGRYTSAQLVSNFAARYGRFEARMKLPSGKGLRPEFWLIGNNVDCVGLPNGGRIEVMTMRGSRPNAVFGGVHGPGYDGANSVLSTYSLPHGETFREDFHVFAIDWKVGHITWSVDGEVYASRSPSDFEPNPWIFDHPFKVVIGLAVGGHFDGNPTLDAKFPRKMLIDYVRVFDTTDTFGISYPVIASFNANFGSLVWSSEFNTANGTAPPSDQWTYDLTNIGPAMLYGWGNDEHQFYTNETANSATDGEGNLVISGRTDNAASRNCSYGKCLYTSARLKTFQKFSRAYGRFEARIRMPSGQGLWPAFWLLGDNYLHEAWPKCGSLAIEMKGSESGRVVGTIHGPGYSGGEGIANAYRLPDGRSFADDFHIFAIEIEPNRVAFSVDHDVFRVMTPADVRQNDWVFNHPFHIIINLAIGGNFAGYPNENTVFPNRYFVDYVRVYDLGIPDHNEF